MTHKFYKKKKKSKWAYRIKRFEINTTHPGNNKKTYINTGTNFEQQQNCDANGSNVG
jgi:hypothetical protein